MTLSLDYLRSRIHGQVVGPQDPSYDEMRHVFVGGIDRHPAVIIRAADPADVVTAIAVARDTELPFAVRCGGHSGPGFGEVDDGIVLDVRGLDSLEIDADGRTAWAGSGLSAADYTKAVGEHGLATGFGDTGSVGIGGITLNGGIGFLVRKFGMTIDNLLAAEIVTADGQVLMTSEAENADLFWAIRGGGGNFGVVTRFRYRLHELRDYVGGMILLPATADVVNGLIDISVGAPEEFSAIVNVMTAPPLPFVPDELHGKLIVMVLLGYAGTPPGAENVLGPIRALARPIADMVHPMAYPDMFPPEENHRPTAANETLLMNTVDGSVVETILKELNDYDAAFRVTQIRALGGAMARVPAGATAYGYRDAGFMVNLAAAYSTPEEKAQRHRWVTAYRETLDEDPPRAYVGFLDDVPPERVRAAYPENTWQRLTEIKGRYDPENVFHRNQNIPPA